MVKLVVTQATIARQNTPQGPRPMWVVVAQVQAEGAALGGQAQIHFAAKPGELPPLYLDDVLTLDKLPPA